MGRRLRSHLSMIHPGVKEIGEATQELVQEKVRATQNRQKKWHDKMAKPRSFIIGDQVLVLNFGRGPKWLPGKVTSIRGPVSVTVELADGRSVRRHYDHIRASSLSEAETVVQRDVVPRQQATWSESLSLGSEQELPPAVPAQEPVLAPEQEQPEPVPEMETEEQLVADPTQEEVPPLRRSSRVRRPTAKLKEGGM